MFAIDCGNTRIKWARFEGGQRLDDGHAGLDDNPYAALSEALVGGIDRVLVANVAGADVGERVSETVRSRLGIDPEFATVAARAHGIECAYDDPASLGVDRWLMMIAGRRQVRGPLAVVGAGTAVTFDAVDASGRHLGGLILPGDRLMIEAIARNTDRIGVVAPAREVVLGLDLLGRTTSEAVSHGARLALVAAIERAVAIVGRELESNVSVLVSGGDGPALADWLACDANVTADLVLDGLAAIASKAG